MCEGLTHGHTALPEGSRLVWLWPTSLVVPVRNAFGCKCQPGLDGWFGVWPRLGSLCVLSLKKNVPLLRSPLELFQIQPNPWTLGLVNKHMWSSSPRFILFSSYLPHSFSHSVDAGYFQDHFNTKNLLTTYCVSFMPCWAWQLKDK